VGVLPIAKRGETMHQHERRWPMFNRVLEQARHMDEVMRRLGVDPGLAARQEMGAAFARAQRVCLFCPYANQCEEWLAYATDVSQPPPFCLNAGFFASCRLRSSARRRMPEPAVS
jgi:hypothetical protein